MCMCVCMCVGKVCIMNIDNITIFMRQLRSVETKCPSCNEKKHTKECDFGDFRVVDDLSALYVDPAFESSSDLKDKFLEFLAQRATRPKYLDCVCYVLTNDIIYKHLGIEESEMVKLYTVSKNPWVLWIRVNQFLRKNQVLRDTSDTSLPSKIGKSLKALELYCKIKGGTVGHYSENTVTTRQKMIASSMIYFLTRILQSL